MKKFLIFAIALGLTAVAGEAIAQSTPAFLDDAIAKGDSLVALIAGPIAKLVCTFALIGAGILWYMEKIEKKTLIRIAIATALITGAGELVNWLFD